MLQCYKKSFSQPMADSGLILKINILSFYPGTKYRDVCISEIFFNDCFVPRKKNTADHISKIYTNKNENALLLDKPRHKGMLPLKTLQPYCRCWKFQRIGNGLFWHPCRLIFMAVLKHCIC